MPTSGISRQPIVFFGTEDFSLYSLRALVEAGFNIAAVITKPDSRRGRSNKLIQPAVKQFASQHHIPVWQPNRLKDIISDIKNNRPIPAWYHQRSSVAAAKIPRPVAHRISYC